MLGRSNVSQNWSAEESNLDRYLIAKLPTEIATGTSTGYNKIVVLVSKMISLRVGSGDRFILLSSITPPS